MKWDIIVGNPPYNGEQKYDKKGTIGNTIWPKFVEKSLSLLNPDGYLCYVHPASWRKPNHKLWKLLTNKQIKYLEIHSKKDGQNIFNAAVKYDWYILQNTENIENTIIIDELNKKNNINLKKLNWLASYNFKEIKKLVANNNEQKCEILYSSYIYETRRDYISKEKTNIFKYPCVYAIHNEKNGNLIFTYSTDNTLGFFGEKKVILSLNEKQYPYNDYKGEFGMSQNIFAIKIKNKKEGDLIVKAINTEKFKEIIKSTKWGTFVTEWKMFKDFKKDFWKYFVDENGNEI